MLMRTACVAAPCSERLDRLFFRRMTAGRKARSAKLLSKGTSGLSRKVNNPSRCLQRRLRVNQPRSAASQSGSTLGSVDFRATPSNERKTIQGANLPFSTLPRRVDCRRLKS